MFPLKITSAEQLQQVYWLHDADVLDIRFVHDDEADEKALIVSCLTCIENDPPELDERRLTIRFEDVIVVTGTLLGYQLGIDQIDDLAVSKSAVFPMRSNEFQRQVDRLRKTPIRMPNLLVALWFTSGSQLDIACISITITEQTGIQ